MLSGDTRNGKFTEDGSSLRIYGIELVAYTLIMIRRTLMKPFDRSLVNTDASMGSLNTTWQSLSNCETLSVTFTL